MKLFHRTLIKRNTKINPVETNREIERETQGEPEGYIHPNFRHLSWLRRHGDDR